MKVLLVDVDSKMPNPALMKISASHKARGNTVGFDIRDPDKVYISCIFEKNRAQALGRAGIFNCPVEVGGYGVSDVKLPDEIEHLCPDYSLYGIHYSMGFTSRGCIRSCPWCIVPKVEGQIRDHAPLNEFLRHKKLILLDNNFLVSPRWSENLKELIARKIKVNFNQGLDIRLVDQENAKLLSRVRYYDWHFKEPRLHFAFDLPEIEDDVLEGIRTLEKAGIPRVHLMFYVLVGFDTSYEEDLHRVNLLLKERVKPYIMPFNDRHDTYYPHLERWINGRYYEVVPWERYDHGDSQRIIKEALA